MATLKLRAIGNSVGVVLPKELLGNMSSGMLTCSMPSTRQMAT